MSPIYRSSSAILAIAAVMLAPVAYAQATGDASPDAQSAPRDTVSDPDAAGPEDIVVTGIRRSLADAINLKRNQVVISDAISAEDIGRFPDQNLAESLQRITGVQITRNKGEGAAVSVRGLSPDFTRTQYNGRTLTTPTGGRSFSFTSLTSDFVGAVEVFKTPTADQIDGGLSATINVRTARPLDTPKDRVALTIEGIYEDNPRKVTPHVAGYVNKVFADGTFGVNFGVNFERRRVQTFNYAAFGLENATESTRNPPLDYNLDGDTADTFRINHAAGLGVSDGFNERLTFVGGMQFKPSDTIDLYADVFYSKYRDEADNIGNVLRFTNIAGPGAGVRGSVIDDNVVTFLDADGVDLRNNGRHVVSNDSTFSAAAGGKFVSGQSVVSTEFSYSRSRRAFSALGLEVLGRASASYDLRPDPSGIASVAFTRGYDPLDPTNFFATGFNGEYKQPTTDRNYDGRIDYNYDFDDGFIKAVKFGGIHSNRLNVYRSSSVRMSARTLADALGVPYDPVAEAGSFNGAAFMQSFSYPRALNNYSGGAVQVTDFLSSTNDLLFDAISLDDLLALSPPVRDLAREYSVNERVTAAYARLDFASGNDRLAGNVGVRYVYTNQRTEGYAPDLTQLIYSAGGSQTIIPNVTPVTVDNNYRNVLPSFNLRFNASDRLVVRLGAARVMSRPDLGLLSTSTSVDANVRTVNQFNPQLRPYLADQLDLSAEYYFGRTGLISAAVFYKDIKNFIVSSSRVENLTVTQLEGGAQLTFPFRFFSPANGTGGKLKGLEVGAQLPFTFLPGALDGLGVIANLTLLDVGEVSVVAGEAPLPLPGVSDTSYNLVGYYEKYGFGLRLSYNYRSGFTVDSRAAFGDGQFNRGYGQLDASLSYDITPNLTFNLDVTNINEAAVESYNNLGYGRGFEDVGRRVTAGIRAKF